MSWSEGMLPASFRKVTFDVISTRDTGSRDVAVHEYPYVDGGDVEDLGRKPRNLRMTAIFWGDTYEQKLQALIAALDEYGGDELIHPVFGSMPNMQCIEYGAFHEADMPDYCVVELVFLECTPGNPFFTNEYSTSFIDELFNKIQGLLDMAQDLFDTIMAPIRMVQKYMAKAKALLGAMVGMVTTWRGEIVGFISSVRDFLNYPSAFLSDLRSALSFKSHDSTSRIKNSRGGYSSYSGSTIVANWKDMKAQHDEVVRLPAALISGEKDSPTAIPNGATVDDIKELVAAVAVETAASLAGNAADILSEKDIVETLSPDDIELIVNDVRVTLQLAIDTVREVYTPTLDTASSAETDIAIRWQPLIDSMKGIALDIQNLGNAAITARPPLVRRQVENPCNLHLLAHKWYGNYDRANELQRLNPHLRDVNNIQSGELIYAYAR